ncbi:unnamed protein product [Rhodiola kirilowii]
MSTRLFALLLSKPATCNPAAVLTKSISSSQETYIPLSLRHFSSPPDKTQKGAIYIDDAEMIAMYNKLMEIVRHFNSLPDNAKSNKKNSVDVETMRKMFEEWMAKHRRFYDSEEEKERRFNLFMENVEENVYHSSSLAKSNENEEDSVEEDVEMKKMFEEWMSKFERSYSCPQEKEMRFKAFKENARKINAHNKVEGRGYDKGNMYIPLFVRRFSSPPDKENARHFSSQSNVEDSVEVDVEMKKMFEDEDEDDNNSLSLDWRTRGAVSGVKHQIGRGTCWAFAVAACIEGFVQIQTGILRSLSVEQLVQYAYEDRGTLQGGQLALGFAYVVMLRGLNSWKAWLYGEVLQVGERCISAATIDGFKIVHPYEENMLKLAVSKQPVAVSIHGSDEFSKYTGGVFLGWCSGLASRLDHCLVIVNYGTSAEGLDFWLCKNSYGIHWGENGYIRILRNTENDSGLCGIAIDPISPPDKVLFMPFVFLIIIPKENARHFSSQSNVEDSVEVDVEMKKMFEDEDEDDNNSLSLDWRTRGAVTGVKHQIGRGTCWAFAVAACIEGFVQIQTGILRSLSVEQLAWPNGEVLQVGERCISAATIDGFKIVRPYDENMLKLAVSKQPVAVSIHGSDEFSKYTGGVFLGWCSGLASRLDHCLVIVGYGTSAEGLDFWLCKNSYGIHWGENGYIRILRNTENDSGLCGIAIDPISPPDKVLFMPFVFLIIIPKESARHFSSQSNVEDSVEVDVEMKKMFEDEDEDDNNLVQYAYEDRGTLQGGQLALGFAYVVMLRGLTSWKAWPYGEVLQVGERCISAATIDGFKIVRPYDENMLKLAVSKQPVAVSIHGSDEFSKYTGGVFLGWCSGLASRLDHCLVIVGYGTSAEGLDFWLCKNSYGIHWGENGYIRILRNTENDYGLCGIAIDPISPPNKVLFMPFVFLIINPKESARHFSSQSNVEDSVEVDVEMKKMFEDEDEDEDDNNGLWLIVGFCVLYVFNLFILLIAETCWAFAVAACIEGFVQIQTGILRSLSVEQGLTSWKAWPYGEVLQVGERCISAATNDGFKIVRPYDENMLKLAVSKQPVAVSIHGSDEFSKYTGGVFLGWCSGLASRLDHCLVIVGYGTSAEGLDFWLCKNSYGIHWGENGYIRILRNTENDSGLCGIAIDPMYPI